MCKCLKIASLLLIVFLYSGCINVAKSSQIASTLPRISPTPPGPPYSTFITVPSVSSGRQPMHTGDIPGWHQDFADDFSGTTLDTANFSG